MTAYQIRYTCSGEDQTEVIHFISKNALKYIVAKEFATREHIQCYVEINITKKTWVNKFNTMLLKNKIIMDRRCKYVKEDNGDTKTYVCKGVERDNYEILAKRGFTDEEILAFHNQYWDYHKPDVKPIEFELATNEPEDGEEVKKLKKKPRKPPFMKECADELYNEWPNLEWNLKHKPLVFIKIMRKLGCYCKALDHIILSRMTYGVLNSLIKENDREWYEYWYMKAFSEYLPDPEQIIPEDDNQLDEAVAYVSDVEFKKEFLGKYFSDK